MVAGSRPLAAPDNLMDGAPEERNSSRRRWGWVRRGLGEEKQQKNKKRKRMKAREQEEGREA